MNSQHGKNWGFQRPGVVHYVAQSDSIIVVWCVLCKNDDKYPIFRDLKDTGEAYNRNFKAMYIAKFHINFSTQLFRSTELRGTTQYQ